MIANEEVEIVTLTDWVGECGRRALSAGWHDTWMRHERNLAPLNRLTDAKKIEQLEQVAVEHAVVKTALVITELSEAIEELREGHGLGEVYEGEGGKPKGYPVELADAVIRLFDLAYMLDLDLEKLIEDKLRYNETRGERHGGKTV